MNIWKYLPEREQKRLAHFRAWLMKISGERERKNNLRQEKNNLKAQLSGVKSELKEEREDREKLVRTEVRNYISEAAKLSLDLQRAYQEVIAGILTKEPGRLPSKTLLEKLGIGKRSLLRQIIKQRNIIGGLSERVETLSSGILPYSAQLLAEKIPKFAKAPLMIFSPNSPILYISDSFKKICKIPYFRIREDARGNHELTEKLNSGENYKLVEEDFSLIFVPYRTKEKLISVSVSATPKKSKGHERAHNLFRQLIDSAISELQTSWRGYNKKPQYSSA